MEPLADEQALISAAAEGDGDSFSVLVGRYQEVAFRAAWLIVRDHGEAQDVAQDAFVRAYLSLRRFREGEPFRPWLLRIVTNLALNETRSRRRRLGLLTRFGRDPAEPVAAPEPLALANDQQRRLHQAIATLAGDDQVVLYLRYFLDLPEREISVAIGKPAGTVKSRLHRASTRLRTVIEHAYPDLGPGGGVNGGGG